MIEIHSVEQRTQVLPGQPPMTVTRTVDVNGCKGRKTVRFMRGSKVVSTESEPLTIGDCKKVHRRRFVKGLYRRLDRKTKKRVRHLI